MSNEEYISPTLLDPAPRDYSEMAGKLARWVVVPLLALLVAIILVFYVFFSTAVVRGDSMTPTLLDGDYLLVTRVTPSLQRGDVIVTQVQETKGQVELVKRVIGLPGDTVEIKSDVAYVNGVAEPSRGQFILGAYSLSRAPVIVPPGSLYVLGDNRPISEDSRYIGPVPIAGLKGHAVAVFAPLRRIRPI